MSLVGVSDLLEQARASYLAGEFDAARRSFGVVLAQDPLSSEALMGLAQVALAKGEPGVAMGFLERILAVDPAHTDARLTLADVWLKGGQPGQARIAGEQVLSQIPGHPPAHFLLGHVFWALGDFPAAFDHFSKARLDLVPALFGQLQYVCHQRLAAADWRGYDAQAAFFERSVDAGLPVWQPLLPMLTSGSQAYIARATRSYAANHVPPKTPLWQDPARPDDGKIRLGFLTAELWNHPVAHLMRGPLEQLDRDRFEVVAFSYGPVSDDPVRKRLIAAFDEVHEVGGLSDEDAARQVHARGIDIAVTLNGLANLARPGVLAHRPAAVQVSLLGYPGTMASPFVDYLIADSGVVPEADFAHFAEKIVWMPDTYQPTDDQAEIGVPPSRADEGLPEGAFVFMAYNIAYKISPATFYAWMRILRRVEGSVLWLPIGEPGASVNFRREAQMRGVDPARLIFAQPRLERGVHIARHQLADLFLDTLPYNAHSTASDALWAGLPVISCRGTTFPGRVCASLLSAAGLGDLVTTTVAEYENLAVALASDPARLAGVRARTRAARTSPLFDTARYTRHLEQAFSTMREISLAGEAPRAFAVDPGP